MSVQSLENARLAELGMTRDDVKKGGQKLLRLREFKIEDIPMSCTFTVIGPPGSGKTTFIKNLVYYLKHRYPVLRAFVGTEGGYEEFGEIAHPLYTTNCYKEDQEKSHILRQRKCAQENGSKNPANYAINILDDVTDDSKILKTKTMKSLYKMGSQHYHQLFVLGSQYALDMPPDIRKSTSYSVIFFEPTKIEREKLWRNFGSLIGTFPEFEEVMNQVCQDHTCLIFKNLYNTTSNPEDSVFWFQTKLLKPFKFGCKEYHAHAEHRYNKNHVDNIDL